MVYRTMDTVYITHYTLDNKTSSGIYSIDNMETYMYMYTPTMGVREGEILHKQL